MVTTRIAAAIVAAAALALSARPGLAAEALPKLGADLPATSVSGLSSGAFMAVQIEVPIRRTLSASEPAGAVLAVGGAAKRPTGPV